MSGPALGASGGASSSRWSAWPRSRCPASCGSRAAGPPGGRLRAAPRSRVRVRGDAVDVRLWVIARPGADAGVRLAAEVRAAVAAAVERLLGLAIGGLGRRVVVDGVGGSTGSRPRPARARRAAPRARGALRGGVRAAHRDGRPGAPPGRDRGATRRRPSWPASWSPQVVAHRDTIDARIERRGAPVPGRPAGPDGPRSAPLRASARCYTRRDAGPGGDRRVGRARAGLQRRPARRLVNGVLGRIATEHGASRRSAAVRRTGMTPGGRSQWPPPTSD